MSLSTSIQSQRSYGSTSGRGVMLSVNNSDLFVHKVESSDTLQGLAIKYGVKIEELKRVNKLWTNEFLHLKETLVIPCSSSLKCKYARELSLNNDSLCQGTSNKNELNHNNMQSGNVSHNQLEFTNSNQSSDFKSFVGMLSKIDDQINLHKKKYQSSTLDHLPSVTFDSYQHLQAHMSPTRSMSPLEQGI